MTDGRDRTGAESLVQIFGEAGVDVCFANPGTSEMHFVAALDTHPELRCVLGLFEGVATGAADGAEAVQAAQSPPGQIATLILPADTAWNRTAAAAKPLPRIEPRPFRVDSVAAVAAALRSGERGPSLI
jgi:thiamine pyrophosphate-dependent acetolactate synthase large subunit-like protein